MAKLFLDTTDSSYKVSNSNTSVYGASGTQVVTIDSGITGVTLDQGVEGIKLSGSTSEYTYKQAGNVLEVYQGTALVTKVAVQDTTAGTALTFSNGTAAAKFTASNGLTLGDAAVNATSATAISVTTDGSGTSTGAATYSIASSATSVTEGNALTFTVTASAAAAQATTLTYLIEGATSGVATAATPSSDLGKATGTVTIAAGATTGTFTITPTDDGVVEGFEAFKVSVLNSSFNAVASTTPIVIIDGAPAVNPVTLTLTAGIDTGAAFTGTTKGDTFIANNSTNGAITLTTLDSIDGGDGIDTLSITLTTAAIDTTTSTSYTVKNIEIANLVAAANSVTANTSTWYGLTDLSTNGVDAQTVTAASTTNVSVGATSVDGNTVNVQGGKDVTVTSSGVTTGITTVGSTATAPVGAVSVNVTSVYADGADVVPGDITTTGGATVSITQLTGITPAQITAALSDGSNWDMLLGDVFVYGTAVTTDVTVNQSAAVTQVDSTGADGKIGVVDGAVTIADVNAASATAAGSIATVTLANYGTSTIASSALTTVNLSGTAGTLGIDRGALTAVPTANTLTINLSGLISGTNTITDSEAASDDGFTTVNINANTSDSNVAALVFADATTVNIGGAKALTIGNQTLASAGASIVSTNSTGVTLSTELATGVAFTGGAGADSIKVGATTKTINTGAGNDTVVVSVSALPVATATTTAGSIDGGDGTDTLSMTGTLAAAASINSTFAGTISGFERLSLGAEGGTINLNYLDAINYVTIAAGNNTTTIRGALSGATVVLPASSTTGTVDVGLANDATGGDTLNINLAASNATNTLGTLTATGFETLNFATSNTSTSPTAQAHALSTLDDANVKSIVVSGNAGLSFTTVTTTTALTSFDASQVTLGAVSFTTVNLAAAATLTGGAGADTLSAASATTATVTLNGNGGNDTLTGSISKSNTIYGGTGDDTINGGSAADLIDGGEGSDTFVFSSTSISGTSAGAGTVTGAVINLSANSLSISDVAVATSNVLVAATVPSNTASYMFGTVYTPINPVVSDTLTNIENATGTNLADYIVGSTAANKLTGGAGIDTLTGGTGADTFVLDTLAVNTDVITDFVKGTDIIDLSAALTAATLTIGSQVAFDTSAKATTITSITTAANTDAPVYYIKNTAGHAQVLTLAEIETAITAGSNATGEAVVLIDNGTSTSIYFDAAAQTDAGSGAGLILVGTLTGITGATALATGDLISV